MLSVSHSLISTPNGSVHNPSGLPSRRGTRLSPVTEHRTNDPTRNRSPSTNGRNGSRPHHRNSASSVTGSHHAHHSDHHHKHSTGGGTGDNSTSGSRHHHSSHHSSSGSKPDELTFPRRKVPPIRPVKSALTAMLAKTSSSMNPFEEYYAAISGRAEGESKMVAVYFPKATKPIGQVMELNVRKDSTVEEVLGHALYRYWEEGWLPKLDDGLDGEEDPRWSTACSAVGWIFRIAEEDGEVDEDFPPPDRTGKISKFNFDAYAVLGASPAQSMFNSRNPTVYTD
jgi:target of rapamycin complex 2 subunit MAPKAP1